MRFVIFGLTVSSSWGNGHATLWRGLIRALVAKGHEVLFFEHDAPWYAQARDLHAIPGAELILYPDWAAVRPRALREVARADAAMVTSYCPDGVDASALVLGAAPGWRLFYDLDTPVTLARLAAGEAVPYLPPEGLGDFDLVLSYTGGAALSALRERLGARAVAPLYGHVDPQAHRPAAPQDGMAADLSYIGTYAADRQAAVEALFVGPARARPDKRFVLAGSGYGADFPWQPNIFFVQHLPPADHPGFFAASRLTLNVTRGDMKAMGWCPSGRLFEAAACGTPLLSDAWDGLSDFFEPGREIIVAETGAEATAAVDLDAGALAAVASAARERVLAEHTSAHRADELLELLNAGAEPLRARG